MRIKHKVTVRIAEDTLMQNLLFGPDDVLAEIVLDDFQRTTSGLISINTTVTENLPLGDVDAVKGLYLRVSDDCIIKLNGGTQEIQLRKSDSGTSVSYAKFFIEADISQVAITAGATAVLTGMFCAWGDPSS